MRKVVILFIFCVAVTGGIFLGINTQKGRQSVSPEIKPQITPTSTSSPKAAVGLPASITIPSLQVSATIESVGMDLQGRMDIPKNVEDTAWYNLGYRPGQKGSAVIDGHYDTQTGAPAVFYNIAKLHPGDRILITDDKGTTYTFTVTQNTNYPYNQLPMQQIFNSSDKARLNLITCSGVWDHEQHNYSTRDVVYSELSSTTASQ